MRGAIAFLLLAEPVEEIDASSGLPSRRRLHPRAFRRDPFSVGRTSPRRAQGALDLSRGFVVHQQWCTYGPAQERCSRATVTPRSAVVAASMTLRTDAASSSAEELASERDNAMPDTWPLLAIRRR